MSRTYLNVLGEIDMAGSVEAWIAKDPDNRGQCELCGEVYDHMGPPSIAEVGEFVSKRTESDAEGSVTIVEHVIAHAQCGFDRDLDLA